MNNHKITRLLLYLMIIHWQLLWIHFESVCLHLVHIQKFCFLFDFYHHLVQLSPRLLSHLQDRSLQRQSKVINVQLESRPWGWTHDLEFLYQQFIQDLYGKKSQLKNSWLKEEKWNMCQVILLPGEWSNLWFWHFYVQHSSHPAQCISLQLIIPFHWHVPMR